MKTSIVLTLLLSVLLFGLWIGGSVFYLYLRDGTLTSIRDEYDYQKLGFPLDNQLVVGEKISGEFQAKSDFLGSVAVKISGFYRKSPDFLNFRIRRSDQDNWLALSSYEVSTNSVGELREFGFLPMRNSRSNSYYFEITSTLSQEGDMVMIDTTIPTLVVKYQYPVDYIFGSASNLINFIATKLEYLKKDTDFFANSFVFIIPLIAFLTIILSRRFKLVILPIAIVLALIILDLFIIPKRLDFYYLFALLSWVCLVFFLRLEAEISGLITLTVFLISLYALGADLDLVAARSGFWTYAFFLVFIIGKIYQLYFKSQRRVTLSNLISSIKEFLNSIRISISEINYTPSKTKIVLRKQPNYFRRMYALLVPFRILLSLISKHRHSLVRLMLVLLVGYSLWHLLVSNLKYLTFYTDFFPKQAIKTYLQYTGIKILGVHLLTLFIIGLLVISKKTRGVGLLLCLVITLFFNQKLTDSLFAATTSSFREKIYIWDLEPAKATLWDNVIIVGRNFENEPFVGKVLIDGVEHRIIKWTDRRIVFITDPTKTRSGELVIIRNNGVRSDPVKFEYY